MRRTVILLAAAVAACASPAPPSLPPGARPDLAREWVGSDGFRWPPRNGFAEEIVFLVLPAGVLLDRFGSEGGRFFSPKGATFAGRALPYVCPDQTYRAYRVVSPLPVRIGSAAAWFGQGGGAMQIMTDATAAQLVADGTLERLPAATAPC